MLHFDEQTGQGWFDIMTDHESGGADGKYTILLSSSGLRRSIEVDVKIVGNPLKEYYDYGGAFWRADQTGERVVALANTGSWTAAISYTDGAPSGWVVLAPGKSLDPDFWTDEPGDAELFPVEGSISQVSGTGNIYLRIRCSSENTGTSPRYAVLNIADESGTIISSIYLRQGEQTDYLMRPGDPAGPDTHSSWAGSQTRPLAAKYTPYNLTSQEYLDGTKTGGTDPANHSQVGFRGGVFTKYPSQGGAYFQWANEYFPTYAWHPTNPTGAITGWSNDYPHAYWDALKGTHETCPPGFRRPTDGSTSGINTSPAIADSEQRQSLWLNPQNATTNDDLGNSLWGYLADGFFDRHYIQDSNTHIVNVANSAVRPNSADVGYTGRLFYNPNNNASLFIPASGYRYGYIPNSDGQLMNTGYVSNIWSASSYSGFASGWILSAAQSRAYQTSFHTTYGHPVRCVVDEQGSLENARLSSTGRYVATKNVDENGEPTDASSTSWTWADAMGISDSYNSTYFYTSPSSTGTLDNYGYTPTAQTGCNLYYEDELNKSDRGLWRLPTRDQLWEMYQLGHLPINAPHWSSTEVLATTAVVVRPNLDDTNNLLKTNKRNVRCVRAQ